VQTERSSTFLEIVRLKVTLAASINIQRLSLYPLMVELQAALSRNALYSQTRVSAWERFCETLSSSSEGHRWTLAVVHLHHPVQPDADPVLALLGTREKSRDALDMVAHGPKQPREHLWTLLNDTIEFTSRPRTSRRRLRDFRAPEGFAA